MKRVYVFVGFVVLIALAGYPFVQELQHVSDVKESKSDFQNIVDDRGGGVATVRRSSQAWENLPERLRQDLRELGFFPASLPNGSMAFRLKNFDDESVELRDYTGQWLLINFWATWCPPCRMEMPSLDQLQHQFDTLTVVTINVEQTRSTIRRFKNNYDFTMPVLIDSDGRVSRRYGVTGLPESWVITPEGKPLAKLNGPLEWHKEPATGVFKSLFQRNNSEGESLSNQ